ncbi:MAG: hypothetical protein DME25_06885 [Verrucomicrobia bacterium]|nr:MAG: hypothetical protein DME25_06885 [Verrucomicrobiota bacterium]
MPTTNKRAVGDGAIAPLRPAQRSSRAVPEPQRSGKGMKRIVQLLLAAVGLCPACSRSDILTPREFTRAFADALRKADPGLKVAIVRDLELKITSADGRDSTSFFDNAYDMYKQDPKAKHDVIQRFVTAGLDSIRTVGDAVDRARIVPVIKDRPWLEETGQALVSRGAKKVPEYVYENFSPDLIILYAEDSPKHIRYLEPKDLEVARIQRSELRALACANLKRILSKIERHGTNGLYMITAGGDCEASLLVLDSMWSGGQFQVKGDVVVAIPTRDLLLVTGSQTPQGIKQVKKMVKDASTGGAYRVTQKLFVYRNGRFSEFNGAAQDGATNAAPPHR